MTDPVGSYRTLLIIPVWSVILASSVPVSASQNLMLVSSLPEITVHESGLKAQVQTQFLWAWIVVKNFFSAMFQSFKVLSSPQETSNYPSHEKLKSLTGPVCDLSTFDYASILFVHNQIVLSDDPEAIRFPVGLMSIA